MVKFNKQDFEDWSKFRLGTKQHLSAAEFELVCQLHAKYFIKWLSKISFHELRYHHSNEAISVFNNLIPLV